MTSSTGPAEPEQACQLCGAPALAEAAGAASLPRVTSDCKPFRAGGRLAACRACGGIQAIPDERWRRDVAEIYATYEPYHQSAGVEQSVFDATTGAPRRRSAALVARLKAVLQLPSRGRLLDVGCGNGAMLSAAADALPGWSLSGHDLDARHREHLVRIPGFANLHTGPLDRVADRFDLVTMSHSLEHIPGPGATLDAARDLLGSDGRLFVQVPDADANPFDLVVADHLSHFTVRTLSALMRAGGYAVEVATTEWIGKEISVLARPHPSRPDRVLAGRGEAGAAAAELAARIAWLEAVVRAAATATREAKRFAVFGTSIAGTWLFASLGSAVEFFVDEDPARAGGRHLGLPVLHPSEVPAGTSVYLALVPAIAAAVAERLRRLPRPLALHGPPALDAPVAAR